MNLEIVEAFSQIVREKAIEKSQLLEMVRAGLLAAVKKKFGPAIKAEVAIDSTTGEISVVLKKRVVEEITNESQELSLDEAREYAKEPRLGEEIDIPVPFSEFGRSAVQAAKQMVIQKVREGERERIREEYSHRVGELLSGTVQHVERGNYIIFLNRRAEAILPGREVSRRERFRQGETVRASLIEVRDTTKGPQLILSRTHPFFLKALFGLEVPEIAQGIVEIKGISREAGSRSKIAVRSRDEHVDPVGACVGVKGSRVQAIVNELGGERIDIVPWAEDPTVFVGRSLSPAKIYKVLPRLEEKAMAVVAEDDQLSLAIGKGGQNVRLASQLTGWKIDLLSKSEHTARELQQAEALFPKVEEKEGYDIARLAAREDFPLTEIPGIGPKLAERLASAGFHTFNDMINATAEELLAVPGIGPKTVEKLLAVINELTEEVPAEEE